MSFARGPKWRNQKVEHRLNQLSKLVEADFEGVTVGYKKELELRGLGFKWQLEENKSSALDDLKGKGKDSNSNVLSTVSTLDLDGDTLVMNIGFSHEVRFTLPAQVKCEVLNPTELVLRSTSKDMLGRTSKDIQKLPRRDVYKGKGIFEKGFMPRLKEAKRK
jgi:large subunit ribosomal protein L6